MTQSIQTGEISSSLQTNDAHRFSQLKVTGMMLAWTSIHNKRQVIQALRHGSTLATLIQLSPDSRSHPWGLGPSPPTPISETIFTDVLTEADMGSLHRAFSPLGSSPYQSTQKTPCSVVQPACPVWVPKPQTPTTFHPPLLLFQHCSHLSTQEMIHSSETKSPGTFSCSQRRWALK